MIKNFSGKRVTVMGLGLHGGGASAAVWLARHGARVLVTDLKTKKQLATTLRQFPIFNFSPPRRDPATAGQFSIRFVLGKHRREDFIATDMVVRNPAVPVESPFLKIAQKHGVPIENEATLFFKYCKSKNIIGVTGTRGKSTTAAMIATVLKENYKLQTTNYKLPVWLAGNIRTTPMLSIVDRVRPNDWVVLELSSWHLEDMDRQKISPHIAVVTNLMPDHLNRYTGMHQYARAKESIVRHQKKGDIAVLNKENTWTRAMAKKTKGKVVWFRNQESPHQSKLGAGQARIPAPEQARCGAGKNQEFFGEHNRANAEAAATVARAIDIPERTISSALKKFRGLPDRCEYIRTVRGVRYYNDTTATTPDATIAALDTLSRNMKRETCNIILIAGGADKNLDYKSLIPWIKKTCKAVVLLPGAATEKIKKMIHDSGFTLHVREAKTMREAVKKARALAQRGDIILLSPAAASFGIFQHEFDRGDQFRRVVKNLTT